MAIGRGDGSQASQKLCVDCGNTAWLKDDSPCPYCEARKRAESKMALGAENSYKVNSCEACGIGIDAGEHFCDRCGTMIDRIPDVIAKLKDGPDKTDSDPLGIPQHAPGAKLDAEKPRVGLVFAGFANALLEVAKVGTFGAKKYTDDGWMSVPNGEARYRDAMLRHDLQSTWEEIDADSGLMHEAQVAWNALAKLELKLRGRKA